MGKCHFQRSWLEKTDNLGYKLSSWLKKEDHEHAWCTVCEVSVNVGKGFQSISQHYETRRHSENMKIKLGVRQLHLTGKPPTSAEDQSLPPSHSSKNLCLISSRDSATRAELVWAMKCVLSNFPAVSCDGVADVFHTMFPEGVPQDFSLNRTKFSYLLTEALGPFFRDRMLEDVHKSYFSIQYDETTNAENKKELQVALRYWSHKENQIVTSSLQTVFLGSATAEVLSSSILASLENASLSLSKLIMIGSDGPRVNQKVFRLINEEVEKVPSRTKGLLHVGTCNLHIVNNAFLKGLEAFGSDVADLVVSVYYHFHGWPSRSDAYAVCQEKKGVPKHAFIKHSSTRWLTLEAAVLRLLEQWPALTYYFLQYLPSNKNMKQCMNSSQVKKIVNFLKYSEICAELKFVVSSAQFSKFCAMFQKQEPLIHILHEEVQCLLLTIMKRVCKEEVVKAAVDSGEFHKHHFDEDNLLYSRACGVPVCEEVVIQTTATVFAQCTKAFCCMWKARY